MAEMTYGKQAVEVRPIERPGGGETMILVQFPHGFIIVAPEQAIELAGTIIDVARSVQAAQS